MSPRNCRSRGPPTKAAALPHRPEAQSSLSALRFLLTAWPWPSYHDSIPISASPPRAALLPPGGLASREVRIMPAGTYTNLALAEQLLDVLDKLSGVHPGFRPAHAKGLMCSGTFSPSPEAVKLTRAPH